MVWYVLLRPLRPELDGQDPFQICGLLCQRPALGMVSNSSPVSKQCHRVYLGYVSLLTVKIEVIRHLDTFTNVMGHFLQPLPLISKKPVFLALATNLFLDMYSRTLKASCSIQGWCSWKRNWLRYHQQIQPHWPNRPSYGCQWCIVGRRRGVAQHRSLWNTHFHWPLGRSKRSTNI
jgi:hypothetical protein